MAETYSLQYQNAYRAVPHGNNYAEGARYREFFFSYTQVLAGAAADTILLLKLPPQSILSMIRSYLEWSAFTATATLDIGWQAYVDVDGTTQAASAGGLMTALLLTTASIWSAGMLLTATPDDSKPVIARKVFNNRDPVTIFATIGVAAPGVAALLSGSFSVVTP